MNQNLLKTELKQLGFKSVLIEGDDPNNIYAKVWFDFEMNGKKHSDGRQEFHDIGNAENVFNHIVKWIKEEKGFDVIFNSNDEECIGSENRMADIWDGYWD